MASLRKMNTIYYGCIINSLTFHFIAIKLLHLLDQYGGNPFEEILGCIDIRKRVC